MRTDQEVLNEVFKFAIFSSNSPLLEILLRDKKLQWKDLPDREPKPKLSNP